MAFTASIAALLAALSWPVWPAHADQARRAPLADHEVVTADEVLRNISATGLSPVGRIIRRGDYYYVHAIDSRGIELRVVADTLFGDILSVTAARPLVPAYAMRYDSGPRIIHVPERRIRQPISDAPPAAGFPKRMQLVPLPRPRQSAQNVPPAAVQ